MSVRVIGILYMIRLFYGPRMAHEVVTIYSVYMLRLTILLVLGLLAACNSSDVTRRLGAQCDTKADCDDRCASGTDYPDGLCTETCERDQDCPGRARCIDEEGGICLFACESDVECEFLGEAWECKDKELRSDDSIEVGVCFGQ